MSKNDFNLEKKKIAKEIDNALIGNMTLNGLSEEEALRLQNYSWDDLNKLKDDLAARIIDFLGQVNAIVTNLDIIRNLGDKKEHFNKLVNLFFSDINTFSKKVAELRVLHETKFNQISDLEEFDMYNRIAIMYQSLFSELATLITPTLSEIVLLISDVTKHLPKMETSALNSQEQTQQTVSNEVN